MARLATIDDNERRKYEEFNQRTYGTNLDASRNDRRRSRSTNNRESTRPNLDRRTGARPSQSPVTTPEQPVQRTNRQRSRPTYRPTRKDKRIQAKPPIKKKVSFAIRWLIRFTSFGLFMPQLYFSFITLAFLGGLAVAPLRVPAIQAFPMVAWFIMIAFGWLTVAIILLIFKTTGAHPLLGKQSALKISLFLATLTLYAIPGVNLIPWAFVWAEFVIHNPE